MKLHENGPLIAVPEAFCAPDTVAVYVTPAASELVGVNVATVSAPLKPTVPATLFPAESFTVNDTVPGVTGWENVADGAADTATPVAPKPATPPSPPAARLPTCDGVGLWGLGACAGWVGRCDGEGVGGAVGQARHRGRGRRWPRDRRRGLGG